MATTDTTDSRFVEVLGSRMHHVVQGSGPDVVLLHGNPTSSHLWRGVTPHLAATHRTIAPDLIGMGRSDKPDLPYRFFDHLRYVEGFMDALELDDVTLVVHDWGGGLGLAWARRQPDRVRSIAFMEAAIRPVEWSEATLQERLLFRAMRHPRIGDWLNLRRAFFLDVAMPMLTQRKLSKQELAVYKEPYPTAESRRPVAQWPREIAFSGEPADVHDELSTNLAWFEQVDIPKLLLHAEPGVIVKPDEVARLRATVANLEDVHVGEGKHYLQETHPDAIGRAIAEWLARHDARTTS